MICGEALTPIDNPELDPTDNIFAYRFWKIDAEGFLISPAHNSSRWLPGLNQARCSCHQDSSIHECTSYCGLFAIKRDAAYAEGYFNIETGEVTGTRAVVGCVALWDFKKDYNHIISARYGSPAALCLPQGASPEELELFQTVAERYRVELVARDDLIDTASRFIESGLLTLSAQYFGASYASAATSAPMAVTA